MTLKILLTAIIQKTGTKEKQPGVIVRIWLGPLKLQHRFYNRCRFSFPLKCFPVVRYRGKLYYSFGSTLVFYPIVGHSFRKEQKLQSLFFIIIAYIPHGIEFAGISHSGINTFFKVRHLCTASTNCFSISCFSFMNLVRYLLNMALSVSSIINRSSNRSNFLSISFIWLRNVTQVSSL